MGKALALFLTLFSQIILAAEDISGFWKSIDDKTGKPQIIVGIYPYQGKYYGRIIATYAPNGEIKDTMHEPRDRAPGVIGEPFYSGLDFIWGLQPSGNKYVNGKIMDPEKGKIYDAEVWRQGDNLIVRGKILFFGRNQAWPKAKESDFPSNFQKPDLSSFTPKIPQRKLK